MLQLSNVLLVVHTSNRNYQHSSNIRNIEKAARILPSMNCYYVAKIKYFFCHLMKIKDLYLHIDQYVLGLISQVLPTSRFTFVV